MNNRAYSRDDQGAADEELRRQHGAILADDMIVTEVRYAHQSALKIKSITLVRNSMCQINRCAHSYTGYRVSREYLCDAHIVGCGGQDQWRGDQTAHHGQ